MQQSSENPDPKSTADLREAATNVARTLIDAGYTAYFAGGCVRDKLMGNEPLDYDIATNARPEQVCELFERTQLVGEAFGVVLVSTLGYQFEVATFRTDGVYSDGRHPQSVTYSDAEHDAQRRDFTINGLFEEPLTGKVIDYVNGQEDLSAKLLKAIGDPQARFLEDRLRMLRAVRFAARFGFTIDEQTAEAIRDAAGDISGVSRERIGQELKRMLSHPNRGVAVWELQYLGLDATVLGEENITVAPTRVGRLPDDAPYPTALAAWLLDRDECSQTSHHVTSRNWGAKLMLSNSDQQDFTRCLSTYQMLITDWPKAGVAAQKRHASTDVFTQALMILQTVEPETFVDIRQRVDFLAQSGLSPDPLISGDDLMALGMTPGPDFKTVLESVYDSQLEGNISDKKTALALAESIATTMERD
ncbi:MAG: CCA tRNA nucleotidyltransferase [Planctomycetes bacterium]|nr:CCA tRNA nucleotidyltransferase [Planctomycetota bacterium]